MAIPTDFFFPVKMIFICQVSLITLYSKMVFLEELYEFQTHVTLGINYMAGQAGFCM